jgi:uncharacterized protein (DUF362 family)
LNPKSSSLRRPAKLSRRQFLHALTAAASGLIVAGCRPAPTPPPSPPTLAPLPTAAPAATQNSPAVSTTSTASVPYLPEAQVVIGRQSDYERKAVRSRLEQMLGDLWNFQKIVPSGAKVAIKVNLTGGVNAYQMEGVPATESVVTHPEIVRALGELLVDAGASQIYIVEAVYEWESFTAWGYEEIAGPLNAQLIDLNQPAPYADYTELPVGPDPLIYESFSANRILSEVDTFISVAKMKCHIEAGVTHTMKNLVGMVPYALYREQSTDGARSSFHVDSKTRLPRIIVDLNRARPIHLALIDGIKTIEAGEGTWAADVKQVSPGVLIVGDNALATDTIATAVQGFDPSARYPKAPFTRAENYLNIAHNMDLGTNLLEKIDLLGPSIEDVRYPFRPATGYKS